MPLELRPLNDHQVELYDETGLVGSLIWLEPDPTDPDDDWDTEGWHGSLNGHHHTTGPCETAAEAYAGLLPAYEEVLQKRAYLNKYKNADRWKSIVSVPSGGQPRQR